MAANTSKFDRNRDDSEAVGYARVAVALAERHGKFPTSEIIPPASPVVDPSKVVKVQPLAARA